jgi:hypothetical protein
MQRRDSSRQRCSAAPGRHGRAQSRAGAGNANVHRLTGGVSKTPPVTAGRRPQKRTAKTTRPTPAEAGSIRTSPGKNRRFARRRPSGFAGAGVQIDRKLGQNAHFYAGAAVSRRRLLPRKPRKPWLFPRARSVNERYRADRLAVEIQQIEKEEDQRIRFACVRRILDRAERSGTIRAKTAKLAIEGVMPPAAACSPSTMRDRRNSRGGCRYRAVVNNLTEEHVFEGQACTSEKPSQTRHLYSRSAATIKSEALFKTAFFAHRASNHLKQI